MKNKGFTLVELLAVIVILGVLATIGTMSVTSIMNTSKKNMYCEKINELEYAAKEYAIDHEEDLNFVNDKATVTVKTLLEKGYVREDSEGLNDVKDPRDDSVSLLNDTITIERVNTKFYGEYLASKKSVCE